MLKTPKAELEELFVKWKLLGSELKWGEPTPLENGQFNSSCTFKKAHGESLIKGNGVGQGIKNAQHEAAKEVLHKLEKLDSNFRMQSKNLPSPQPKVVLPVEINKQLDDSGNENSEDSSSDDDEESDVKLSLLLAAPDAPNYVGKLQEHCAKKNFAPPKYSEPELSAVNNMVLFVTSCTAAQNVSQGEATKKIMSKKIAAYKVCKALGLLEVASTEEDKNPSKEIKSKEAAEVDRFKESSPISNKQQQLEEVQVSEKIWYYPECKLGSGGFAEVFKGYKEVPTCEVAIKRVRKEAAEDPKSKELEILMHIKHENLVSYFIAEKTEEYFFYVMELATATLDTWLIDQRDLHQSNSELLVKICKDIATGLNELHKRNIVHRDMKPNNVLIFQETITGSAPKAKLSDFGISRVMDINSYAAQTTAGHVGTLTYMPPESTSKMTLTHSFDIFPLGIVLAFTMTEGKHLFSWPDQTEDYQIQAKIKEDKPYWTLLADPKHTGLKNLLQVMLANNALKRSRMEVLLEHPFFWETDKCFRFLVSVSNDIKNVGSCNTAISKAAQDFLQLGDWKQRLHPKIQLWIEEKDSKLEQNKKKKVTQFGWRKYSGTSVLQLINFIRDQKEHYLNWKSTSLESEEIFGVNGKNYGSYFIRTFPEMPTLLYVVLQDSKFQGNETRPFFINNLQNTFKLN